MAIEGKAWCRCRLEGGRFRSARGRREGSAFGLLSIAVARLEAARSGLIGACVVWATGPPEEFWEKVFCKKTWRARALSRSRAGNGVATTVRNDLVLATIR